MFTAGLFIGGFMASIVAWLICVGNEDDTDIRTVAMVAVLVVCVLGIIVSTIGYYEGWFEVAEEVVEVLVQ